MKDYGRWLERKELQDLVVLIKGCDWERNLHEYVEIFEKHGRIEWAMWVFERAPDTRRDPTGEKGLWWVGGNSLFIKYAEESALVRGPGMPGTTTAFAHHGARIFNKIV